MNESTTNTLMQRLHRVEQDNRRWRWVAVSAMALAVIGPVVLMAQATRSKVANVVEAESFVVRDSTGNISTILGPVDKDRMGLALYDRAGNMRSKLVVKSDGKVGLFLNDQSGDARAKLMVLPDGGPTFALFDEAGKGRTPMRASIMVYPDGRPNFTLRDRTGQGRVRVMVLPDGTAGFALLDPAQKLRAAFVVPPDGTPSLFFNDKNGKTTWTVPTTTSSTETSFSSHPATSDAKVISTTKTQLKRHHIDVRDIRIADGRAKGGERAMIITYAHGREEKNHLAEIVKVLQTGSLANEHLKAEIDSVVAIVGDKLGRTKMTITVKSRDAELFLNTKDSFENTENYLKKWTVAILDRRFLPKIAANMSW